MSFDNQTYRAAQRIVRVSLNRWRMLTNVDWVVSFLADRYPHIGTEQDLVGWIAKKICTAERGENNLRETVRLVGSLDTRRL